MKNRWNPLVMRTLMSFAIGATVVGCSNQTNFLQSIHVDVTEENQISYVNLSAQLDLGNVSLAGLVVPVNDPRTGLNLGTVELGVAPNGKTQIALHVDASAALNADPLLGATLPNGRAIPAAIGAAQGELLAFPILQHSRVYIGGDLSSRVIAGVAIAVKGPDGLMSQVGASSTLFFAKTLNGVNGVAGLYGSPNPDQSGIAVFASFQIPASGPASNLPLAKSASARSVEVSALSAAAIASSSSLNTSEVQSSQGMSDRGKQRVYNYFFGKKRLLRAH